MTQQILDFMGRGALDFSIWQMLLALLAMTSITILSVTIYLHRCQAHRAVDLHPAVQHFFRFWVWLTTGMVVREWVSIHRKHHAFCEREGDPHSPRIFGIAKVLFHGVWLYAQEAKNDQTVEHYGHGCPNDWLERTIYHSEVYGTSLMLILDVWAFGALGISFWAIQILWIPVSAAGVINGLGHWWGYRNFATPDKSTNLSPWGVVIGGEELHNNHHAFPSSAKFALRRWEFDAGWLVIQMLTALGLCTVRRVAPKLHFDKDKMQIDSETLRAVFIHRFQVMSTYCRCVIRPVVKQEATRASSKLKRMRRQARKLLSADQMFFSPRKRQKLKQLLQDNDMLETVYQYRLRLQAIWDRSSTDPEVLLLALKQWCVEAEASGIRALEEFSRSLSQYQLKAA